MSNLNILVHYLNMKPLFLLIAVYSGLCLCSADSKFLFGPITKDKILNVVYKVETFVDSKPHSTSEIEEHYHHGLKASNIKLTKQGTSGDIRTRTYMYNVETDRDVEITTIDENDSLSEACGGDIRVLTPSQVNPLDKIILQEDIPADYSFELDSFLLTECQEELTKNFKHVRGLTRILQLIECRRHEFKLVMKPEGQTHTRGARAIKYIAKLENSSKQILTISVNIPFTANPPETIQEKSIPLSLSLSLKEGSILHIVNVFQLEMVDSMERMDPSLFLMPTGCGIFKGLLSKQRTTNHPPDKNHFSFRAKITSRQLPLEAPIDLDVIFDKDLGLLARKMSAPLGETIHESRLVMDAKSKHKFHITNLNGNKIYGKPPNSTLADWSDCSSSLINPVDQSALETGDGSLFRLDRTVFMGRTEVRNIPCNVYERKLFSLPLWLGFSGDETAYSLESGDTYITFYEAVNETGIGAREEGRVVRDDQLAGKLLMLEVNTVGWTKPGHLIMSYQLDIYQFSWTLVSDLMDLFTVDQECFLTHKDSRYVELEFELEPEVSSLNASKVLHQLERGNLRPSRLMSHLLSQSIHAPPSQQSNLRTEIMANGRLGVQVSVYDFPSAKLESTFVGFTRDPVPEMKLMDDSLQTAKSISFQECEWRAAHSLVPNLQESHHNPSGAFIFCRHSLSCLISRRPTAVKSQPQSGQLHLRTPEEWAKYSVDASHENRCALYEITKLAVNKNANETDGLGLVDWLLVSEATVVARPFVVELNQQVLNLHVKKYRVRHIVSEAQSQRLSEVRNLCYVWPEKDWLRVSSAAQCHHLCLTLDTCRSYSICQRGSQLECLMSRINWTEPLQVSQLRRLAATDHFLRSSSSTQRIQVQLADDSNSVQVGLRQTPLCSISQVDEFDVFGMRSGRRLELVADDRAHLLLARSIGECARLCLDRASVLKRLEGVGFGGESVGDLSADDWATCTAFKFSQMSQLCLLEPLVELIGVADQLPPSWRRALALASEQSKLSRFADMEAYQIQGEQLFAVWHDTRLELAVEKLAGDEQLETRNQWQLSELDKTPGECALLCLSRLKCRSFDVIWEESSGSSECILNALSMADARQDTPLRRANYRQARNQLAGAADWRWRHYEPSSLALHLSGGGAAAEAASASLSGAFLRVSNVTAADHDSDTINKWPARAHNQQAPASERHSTGGGSHLFAAASLLLLMLIAAAACLLLSQRRRTRETCLIL